MLDGTSEWDSPDSWCAMASPFDPESTGPRIHAQYKGWDIHFGNLEVDIYKFVLDEEGYKLPEFWSWAWYQTDRGIWGPLPEFKDPADHRAFLMERVKAYVDSLGY